jgi:uncharacterized C2H2 Zn-finger protein
MQQIVRCPECGREFPTQQALQEHVNRDHMGTMTGRGEQQVSPRYANLHECRACSEEFPSAESLAQHRRQVHSGEPQSV